MPDFNLNRPDDDLVETELAAFGGFWQCQFHDTGPKPANGIDALASFRRLERITAFHPLLKCGSVHEADSGYSCGNLRHAVAEGNFRVPLQLA
jgi:hypothetical protein